MLLNTEDNTVDKLKYVNAKLKSLPGNSIRAKQLREKLPEIRAEVQELGSEEKREADNLLIEIESR